MTYVITGRCCNDAIGVSICPVDCIHPMPRQGAVLTEVDNTALASG
ncbi:hypothetical protein ABQE44_11320 [Mycolicibacterium sp. XJ2546]